MDKRWMTCMRGSSTYVNGVNEFLNFAFANAAQGGQILCPCKGCGNVHWLSREEVYSHLIVKGIDTSYKIWVYHGEGASSSNGANLDQQQNKSHRCDYIDELLHDTYPFFFEHNENSDEPFENEDHSNYQEAMKRFNIDHKRFFNLIQDDEQDLYPGCTKFSKLSFIIRLYALKAMYRWSNASFNALLNLLRDAFPKGVKLPKHHDDARSIMRGLGLEYKKIDACINDCVLFRKEYNDANSCPICQESRWTDINQNSNEKKFNKDRKIPRKVLRHFPIIPRLQRLFMCPETANSMRWHDEGRTKDGKIRHPADAQAWKVFDSLHPNFASDSRNVRLGLASDGFNPFRTMSVKYSMWPVILMPYNFPPWMSLKSSYFMMPLLIPGEESPGINLDVYLEPLIDEFNELWEIGVTTLDASKNEIFQLHAALLWTVSDFPAYAMLSGWSTKGKLACPDCNFGTSSLYLHHSKKTVYMRHRRFLKEGHELRHDENEEYSFDGEVELEGQPSTLSGSDILKHLQNFQNKFGKARKRERNGDNPEPFKKRSIFFKLPYWERNILRHNLDVMHIEKKFLENLLWTLLDTPGKSKDHLNARLDLLLLGTRQELHPKDIGGGKVELPPASFSMGTTEKYSFCEVLKNVRVPDGLASNISRYIHLKERKISGLKSHDCHILLHYLLQFAAKNVLPRHVVEPLVRLSSFFRGLCSKVLQMEELDHLQLEIAEVLCQLETIFPPSFFDIMEHLPIHLAEQAKLGGPAPYRWMYGIERLILFKLLNS